jgi:hypothetical protein
MDRRRQLGPVTNKFFHYDSDEKRPNTASQRMPKESHPSILFQGQENIRKPSNVPRSNDLPSLPKPHDRNRNTPSISRGASVRQLLALDREVQRNVKRASLEEPKSHAVQVLDWQLCDISPNLALKLACGLQLHPITITIRQ